jgi:hypothetical protein
VSNEGKGNLGKMDLKWVQKKSEQMRKTGMIQVIHGKNQAEVI